MSDPSIHPSTDRDDLVADPSADGADLASPGRAPRRKIAPFVALGIAVVIAALFVVFAQVGGDEVDSAATRYRDRPAPELTGQLAPDGPSGADHIDLSRRKGSWVVLNFFDSTCVPCVNEHPELVRFVADQDRTDIGMEFYSVLFGSYPDDSLRYLREHDAEWEVIIDDGRIATALGVSKVPETWIIDPDGFVRQRYISEVSAEFLNQQIAAMDAVR